MKRIKTKKKKRKKIKIETIRFIIIVKYRSPISETSPRRKERKRKKKKRKRGKRREEKEDIPGMRRNAFLVKRLELNDHWRDNRARWRSISGFDESAERPISRRSTIKKKRRLARALKIFKIVCQAELQPRHHPLPPPLPLPARISLGLTG